MKSIWREHVEYLKDNPKRYWFKRKLYGWGWTPATKEGWLVTIIFIALVLATVVVFDENTKTDKEVFTVLLPRIGALVILFLFIAYKKGERPRWQWGENTKDTDIWKS